MTRVPPFVSKYMFGMYIYFEIFPSLTCKVKLIITFSSMSDGDLYEKKNYISLKDCEKAGRIKKYNIAVS